MQTPSSTWMWITEQPGSLVLTGALLLFIIALLSLSARRRRAVIGEARSGKNQSTFMDSLTANGFDAKIARTTYHYLQEKQQAGLPLAADVLLDKDLGLDSVDIDGCIRDLMQLNGRLFGPETAPPALLTVEDLVRHIQTSPHLSKMAAA